MKKIFITVISAAFVLLSCKNDKETTNSQNGETIVESQKKEVLTPAVCLLEKLSVRVTPKSKGKWITSMSLGEKIEFTGEEVTDSVSKKLYYKVRLIDGKEGWTRATFLAVNGKVSTLLKEANVYKRPDLLTKTNKKYSAMDIIAVLKTQDDWMHVKGKRAEGQYIEEGWIKSGNLSEASVDVAVAKFAGLAIASGSMTDKIKALEKITNNADFSSSSLIAVLQGKIEDYKAKNQKIDNNIEVSE
ncbi:SH3 domain-containing protein [Tenacibaculum finnmarkense]|uniref:SH3 domain-containing protein n=1 Tax=Tenacibaculum finnmarkense genomovar finnmarkense TaxID=1458503 RepID=A0AAP1WFR9_9FLAO|nr:SH3 domain-containing protein [Tenacibaculum finnmarkense]MBE7652247.1 SH3 domain-containing protein [Tenacibaculum finnmarkense genomovar finnmarkense]MBE7694581.1 SH3 domain-containing protein [Tenacibaculum finnmarkense genomovar finnmarkense]MCD8426768.1 SH3 domain-containing protein [Tenacibaculum finnmarkense genomovar finnmarkense]MCG8730554.1 SH3 domain-containing protein [Tenacibaculum finnmarkense]MCG8750939.1 SH3 domain-containing protein [Tenacibaculum finnmarkense]